MMIGEHQATNMLAHIDKKIWNSENARKDLETIKKIFDRYNVRLLLLYGTCLGAVRDKDFIKHDDDIDLGVIDPIPLETRIAIGKAMENVGFEAQGIFWYIHAKNKLRPTDKDNWRVQEPGYMGNERAGAIVMGRYVKITVFFFEDNGEEMICVTTPGALPVISSPNKFYKNLSTIKFYGQHYYIPNPVEGYLEYTYKNWREPNETEHGKIWVENKTKEEINAYLRSAYGYIREDSSESGI